MSEAKETFGQKLLKIWYAILKAIGLCTVKYMETQIKKCETQIDDYKDALQRFVDDHNEAVAIYSNTIKTLDDKINTLNQRYQDVYDQMMRYRDIVPRENLEYLKTLEAQLDDVYRTTRDFSFPNKLAIPGSTSMTDSEVKVDENGFIDLKLRMIALDEETAKLNEEPDQQRRYSMMVDMMKRRGLLAKIGDRMITSGAASLAMAYNSDCTNYELYAEFVAKILPDAGLMPKVPYDWREPNQ